MRKKILSLILTLCMLLGMFPFVVSTQALAVSETDGKVHLTTAEDLLALMGDSTLWDKNIILENDIDMTGVSGQSPIGVQGNTFTGSFVGVPKADGSNPEIKGLDIKATTLVNRWGLIGEASGNVTVKNITVSGEISTAGGSVGGIVGIIMSGSLTIENCVNNCKVTSTHTRYSRAGGILGISQNASASIKNCVNNGAISATGDNVGGIVGRFETTAGKTGFAMEIVNCVNNGTVSGTYNNGGAGGIAGAAVDRGGVRMTVQNCLNTGAVTGKGYVGGIVGTPYNAKAPSGNQFVNEYIDCMNTGKITSTQQGNGYVGGIIGYVTSGGKATVTRVYNAGEIAFSAAPLSLAICGVPRTSVFTGAYYSAGPDDANGTFVTPASTIDENKALFPALTEGAWLFSADGPMLRAFHEHTYANGACTVCGEADPASCKHENTKDVIITPATCVSEGLKNVVCQNPDCGEIVERNVTVAKDPTNHVNGLLWYVNEAGTYSYGCPSCGIEPLATQETLPTVYVCQTKLNDISGDDTALGGEDTPVQTIEEAVRRLAGTGGTVFFLSRYTITRSITLPEWNGKITFRGTTDASGNASSGFFFDFASEIDKYNRLTDNNICLSLGGDAEFDTVVFKGKSGYSVKKAEDGTETVTEGKDTVLVIAANWHNVDFTYVRCHDRARVFFTAGEFLSKKDNDAAKNVTVNLFGVAVSSGNPKGFVPFYHIVLGDWFGADNKTVDISNKTVTLNMRKGTHGEAEAELVYTMSTHAYNSRRFGLSSNCQTTINLYDASVIDKLRTGYTNAVTEDGAASLDKLELNFNDNSVITSIALIRNTKDTVIRISDEAAERSKAIPAAFELQAYGAFAESMTGTVTATYGDHSFAAAVEKPIYESTQTGKYTVNATVAAEHSFGEWTVTVPATPTQDGTKTRTCSVCGKEETSTYTYDCAYHQWLPVEGGYKCAFCATITETLTAPITLKIESVAIANGQATVTVSLAATEALKGLRFRIGVPAGFTYVSAATNLTEIPAAGSEVTPSGMSFGAGTDSMVLLNFDEQTLASFEKSNVLTLTYTVDESFTAQSADFTVNLIEVLDDNAASLAADGVGYTWTPSAHEHEYVGTITTPATCGKDGVKTFTCQGCGDSYTEVIPATGAHTFGEWIVTTPAQVGVKGEETRTCPVCGTTETREIPALEPEVYVAYIGNVGYTTVQAAFDAAKALETITVAEGTTETVAPKTTVYLAGDYSGITISGDYMLETTGRFVYENGKVTTDTNIKFTHTAKAIVMPVTASSGNPKGGQSLSLGASVEYKYVPRKTHVDGFAEFFVKYELLGTDGKSVAEGSTDASAVTLTIADRVVSQSDNTRYEYVLDGVPAKCMNNTIRITTYGVNADGSVTVGTKDWGAYVYLQSLLAGTGSLRELAVALTNFGALAQQNFNYNTENLLSDILPEADRKLTVADYAGVTMEKKYERETRTDANDQFEAFASSLQLYDRINIVVTVKSKVGASTEYAGVKAVYSYADAVTGETITGEIPFEEWTVGAVDAKGRTAYSINMNEISARNLRALISLDIVKADGTSVYALQNLTFNAAENYCSTQVGQTTTLATVCYSIMNYCDKAIAYFAN